MYAVTERGVVGRQVDCSILWLQRLQSSYCPDWSLSRWQRGSRTQQIGDVVGLAKTSQAHSQQPGTEAPVHARTCRPSPQPTFSARKKRRKMLVNFSTKITEIYLVIYAIYNLSSILCYVPAPFPCKTHLLKLYYIKVFLSKVILTLLLALGQISAIS